MNVKHTMRVLLGIVLPAIVGLVFLVGVIAWLSGVFGEKIEPSQQSVAQRNISTEEAARVDEVHEITKQYIEEAVGTLKAASRTEISARVLAPIDRVAVRAGERVQSGEVLVELDRQALETQLSQAKASLAAADASLVQANDAYQRALQLRERNVNAITQERFNEVVANLEVAKANKEHAEQAVAEAQVNLSYTTIEAPKSGIIVDRLAEEGDMARPGVPLLVLYDPTSLRLEVPVMENLAVKLKVGDQLPVSIDALDREIVATVDEIVPQAQAASRSFLVKVAIPKSEGLFEGMFGRLRIPAGTRRHLCLATDAIMQVGQLKMVDVVLDDGRLQRRYIKTGRLGMPGRIEVLSGLKAGEKVLLRPQPVAPSNQLPDGKDL